MQKQKRDLILIFIIGFLVGASAVTVWNSQRSRSTDTSGDFASTPTGNEDEGSFAENTSSPLLSSATGFFPLPPSIPQNTRVGLSVPDQPKGKTVFIKELSVTGTKWVAIYDDNEGRPGWILGALRVREGDKEATVSLLRPEGTASGGTYYAAILNDDGDGEFNRLTDLPPLSPENVTVVRFITQ